MLKLSQSSIYNNHSTFVSAGTVEGAPVKSDMIKFAVSKLELGNGIVSQEQLSDSIEKLKTIRRSSMNFYPLLGKVIAMLGDGRIVPFCLDEGSNVVPGYIPFIPLKDKVYVNLIRLGTWAADKVYFNIQPSYLYRALESGVMSYEMIIANNAVKVTNDNTVLETATRLYAKLFYKTIEKTFKVSNEVLTDIGLFLCGKFFLRYVLQKNEGSQIDDIAYKSIRFKTSMSTIKEFEIGSSIDFGSLLGFIDGLGVYLFNKEYSNANTVNFVSNWLGAYGFQTLYAIEFFPYFIHFIFSAIKDNITSSRLYKFKDVIEKDGVLLYSAINRLLM